MAIENNGHGLKPAGASVVKVNNMSMVVPKLAAERPPCPLITFDVPYITFYYNQKLLLYKTSSSPSSDFNDIVGRMKEGLAVVLDHFYPLAGRLAKDDKDGSVVVECSGDSLVGAEVIEASTEGVGVEELAEGEATSLLQEVVPYTGIMNLEGFHRPLLAVQFTKLKDGLALGCAFNHAILDGHSTWHFMTSWAEITRTGSATFSVPPFLDRTKARSVRLKVDLPPSPKAHELADPSGPPKLLVANVFSFPQPALDKLKAEANANLPPGSKPFSTFQSLGAHVWRSVCRARGLKPEDYTVFAIFMDCRTRVDPPMPDSYFGNLIQAIFTVTASGLLLGSPPEFGACLMQKVIDGHDAKTIEGRLADYEAKPKMLHYADAGINCVAVGSSPRFKVYDVDFGFGRPERVRSGSNNKFDGMMFLYPGREGKGGIDVELTLDGEAMKNLEKDETFLNLLP